MTRDPKSMLAFELHLLTRMGATVREEILRPLGLSPAEADEIGDSSPIKIPDMGQTPASEYERILGPPVRRQSCPLSPATFTGSVQCAFLLPSWPHLFWVVHETIQRTTWNIGFQNQWDVPKGTLVPAQIRPGIVTLSVLKELAFKTDYYDGWDECLTKRFLFDEGLYEGEFVWGLLQRWCRVEQVGGLPEGPAR
jgi:hypothetical protein